MAGDDLGESSDARVHLREVGVLELLDPVDGGRVGLLEPEGQAVCQRTQAVGFRRLRGDLGSDEGRVEQ